MQQLKNWHRMKLGSHPFCKQQKESGLLLLPLEAPLNLTILRAFLYIDCTTLINHSSMPNFLKAHHTKSIATRSKAFSKPTNVKNKFFFFAANFSCNYL